MSDNSGLITSALLKTDPLLAASIDAANSWKSAITKRGARVRLYRNYERGDHRANITTQMRNLLRLTKDTAGLEDFNDNYCRVIVDKMASRLHVSNIDAGDTADDWLADTMTRNDFDAQQQTWFRGAIRDGDAYVIVDPETMSWVAEPAYDGFSGVTVIINPMTRKAAWACKLWSEADTADIAGDDSSQATIKLVVYQPDRVSYWFGSEGTQDVQPDNIIPVTVGQEEVAPINFRDWPLGRIPLVHFANQIDNFTQYGESELRPAVPLQDVLNRTLYSMVMASEFSAFKLLWSIGFEIDVDGITPGGVVNLVLKDSNGIITSMTQDQVEFIKAARVGQFDATDLSQYTTQIDKIVQQISQSTQTPIYGVTTQGNLSGEALKQLEIGLLGKVERFQRQNSDAIKELIEMTSEMQNIFDGSVNAPPLDTVNLQWKPAELLDVNARITTLVGLREKSPGLFTDEFYISRIGTLLGMSKSDVQDEAEKAQYQQGMLFDAMTGASGLAPLGFNDPASDTPENLAADKGLNGAQIKAAVDVLKGLSTGEMATGVAVELLVAVGIDRALAQKMVTEQAKISLDAAAPSVL